MSWLFSRALVEAYSGASSSGGVPSARSNSTSTPPTSCWPDKTTAPSRRSRSGTTSAPSPHETTRHALPSARFAASAIRSSSRAAFPARTSVLPAGAKGWTVRNQVSGAISAGSLARYDRSASSWRTRQLSLFEAGCESLETLPPWGMTVGGELFPLQMPSGLAVHRASITSESGYGLPERVPTPTSERAGNDTSLTCSGDGRQKPNKLGWKVASMAVRVPTPTVDGNYNRAGASSKSGDGLATFVTRVPTPTAQDYGNNQSPSSGAVVRPSLSQLVKRVPTPTTQDASNNGPKSQMDRNTKPLNAEVGGPLNPEWVGWLMGFPPGWLNCDAPVTPKSLTRWLWLGRS